ncbi:MAG: phosphate uptake regulator PhoU [Thermofilaceae archaeon]
MASRVYVRRVQQVGYSTLAIALPKKWAVRVGLGKGSKVAIEELPDGSLLVKPGGVGGSAGGRVVAELNLPDGSEAEVERGIIALYEAGYDVMRVTAPNSALRAVHRIVRRLSGVEVISECTGSVTLGVVLDHASLSFERILSRMAELVQLSLDDLAAYSKGGSVELLGRVVERDDELDKFYFLLVRQSSICLREPHLARELGLRGAADIHPLLHYGKTLERMGDILTQLAMYLREYGERLDANLFHALKRAFQLAVDAFNTGDLPAARELTLLYANFFSSYEPARILGSVPLALITNFLALCLDALDSRVELEAARKSIS